MARYPFPQDCSQATSSSPPDWFKDCNATLGGCFLLTVPMEAVYSVGNTSRTTCDSMGKCVTDFGGGATWCIDHINGKVYTKNLMPSAVMYLEIDNTTKMPPGINRPSCRLLVGNDDELKAYDSRVYSQDRILCSANKKMTLNNITYVDVGAGPPPTAVETYVQA
eukprot:CAMPEP_0174718254 /NCGR_PEP_ID=MMETSP1094-20130205/28404_1 /TAXON_ID=156173 /ORGANISM="Chrysochromulina brevifilum, Strain UTEX LB 985" /LENGTH=164 /DNA_ID=CAMNT_0015918311 /DNA_START=84 /DNA_END=578 /DNA_ORIENTATION=+